MFVRYVSHEIRTPLNTVMMGLKLLEKELLQIENCASLLDTVADVTVSCDTAVDILNDLLTYEKLAANILTLDLTVICLKKFIAEVTRPFFLQVKTTSSMTMTECRLRIVYRCCCCSCYYCWCYTPCMCRQGRRASIFR